MNAYRYPPYLVMSAYHYHAIMCFKWCIWTNWESNSWVNTLTVLSLRDSSYSNVQPDQPVDDGHYFSWVASFILCSYHWETLSGTPPTWEHEEGDSPLKPDLGIFSKLWLPPRARGGAKSAELGDMAVIHQALLLTHQPPNIYPNVLWNKLTDTLSSALDGCVCVSLSENKNLSEWPYGGLKKDEKVEMVPMS